MNLIIVAIAISLLSICNAYKIRPRIVKGYAAPTGLFPYYVFLQINDEYACGGSLMSSEWVLTAAHCLYFANQSVAYFGLTSILAINDPETERIAFDKNHFHLHPNYKHGPVLHDIGRV